MLEEAIPSLLASFHTWLTPTVLFVLLNVVIGTIAVTSKASRREDDPIHPAAANESVGAKFSRSSSAVLHRIRSFNIHLSHLHLTTEKPLDPAPPLPPAPATDPNQPDPAPKDLAAGDFDDHLSRSRSSGEIETKIAEQTQIPARKKPDFRHLEDTEIIPHEDGIVGEEGKEVDARADDFINRFRQQLKLQRLDSLIRYKARLG